MFKIGDILIGNQGNYFRILAVVSFNNTYYYMGHFIDDDLEYGVYTFSNDYLKKNFKLKPKEKWGIIYTLSNYIRLYNVTFDSKEKALEIVKQINQKTKPKIFKIPEDAL